MSYFTRRNQPLVPDLVWKAWDEEQHPRVPAGETGGGRFAAGGGEGGGAVRHVPISYGKRFHGIERVVDTPKGGVQSLGRIPEEFFTREQAVAHAEVLNRGAASYGPQNRSDRGRAPLKGHDYHGKTDAELKYIVRDAGEAARAMGPGHPQEGKYLDQMHDASSVLYHRRQLEKKGAKPRLGF